MSNQANAAKRSDDGTKRRKTAKTGKKGRTGDRTTVPEEWNGVAVPCGTVVPPWHDRASPQFVERLGFYLSFVRASV